MRRDSILHTLAQHRDELHQRYGVKSLRYRPEQDSAVARGREAAPEEGHVSLEQ